jgi:ribose transport system permease protein
MRVAREDKPLMIALGFTLIILAVGTGYTLTTNGTAPLLQPTYLLQQLQIGSFLGICAAGLMVVILTGHIDLSIPATLTGAAMIGTAIGGPMAIPAALAFGLCVGLLNGAGVAILRVPSMIFTLGMDTVLRGVTVAQTGGFAPQD